MTASFAVPFVASNPTSWGPPDLDDANPNDAPMGGNVVKFASLPYSPFGRSDRLGRCADFTQGGRHQQYHRGDGFNRRGATASSKQDFMRRIAEEEAADNDEAFQLVDTTKTATTKRFVNPTARRRQHSARLRQINARRQAAGGGPGANIGVDKLTSTGGGRGGGGRGGGGRGGGRGGYRSYGRGYNNRVDRQASVAVGNDWKKVEELDLAKLTKHMVASTEVPNPEDVLWCGFLDPYHEAYDKITARQAPSLKRMENKEFYPVTTTDDPVLEKLAIDGLGQVFITDTILAHLMTCTRSVYPWDLVITKLQNGKLLFFDKRDSSSFDYLTVNETSYNPPTDENGNINTPERLGLEATMINQNFSQQILKKSGRKEFGMPNPFFDEDDADGMEPASVAYRYRKFKLDDSSTLVCRTELHGLVKKSQYMTAFALNEYTPAVAPTTNTNLVNWRDKIDSQRGAVLATELKNNSFKLAKWTAQSLLAGAEQMKIGFVSRKEPKNAYEHQILATQFYRPKDFATQITLSEGQMWAMIRMFVQLLQKQEDGKYVLMRNPNKAVLLLYKVPMDTFEDEE
ncbi:factor 3 subunit D [Seminavis robusta]|uniref:Factor 3 subunit D n=1 Tax=Seminavis robusta TaxID=568900 RepID=A0A9N8E7E8_9STRA|nr:factor 3 subunit D [Seminavis robusta]|eukprot:Sro575_g169400.1 factor 3 subunit D (572) ;mRNA; r:49746-51559